MKRLSLIICMALFTIAVNAQTAKYDSVLSQKLGGDEYGMKMYVLAILRSGTNTTADKAAVQTAFKGHMANMGRLTKEGKLIVAGPLGKNDKQYRGILFLMLPQ